MAYGVSQRRDRAALQSLRYMNRSYPIMVYPSRGEQDVYGDFRGNPSYAGIRLKKNKKRARYGNAKNYGFLPILTAVLGTVGSNISNHLLAQDAQAANAAIAQNQQQIELAKQQNRPYLYMAGAFVIGAVALGTAALFRG